jgi:hypothetical protein
MMSSLLMLVVALPAGEKGRLTLTVAAQGKHTYQTVDFTDTRKGARTEPGPISLQGHDPTTDLSFRNTRVGDLKGK